MSVHCRNNPINSSDPTGYRDIVDSGGGGSAYALALSFAGTAYVSRGIILGTRYVGGIIADFYSRLSVSRANSTSSSNTGSSSTSGQPTPKSNPSGKAKNKLKPDSSAQGDYTTFKRDPETGEITNYETWKVNPKNPKGFDSEKRYDGTGDPHYNKVTKEKLIPHVHDKTALGGVREPLSWGIPIKR